MSLYVFFRRQSNKKRIIFEKKRICLLALYVDKRIMFEQTNIFFGYLRINKKRCEFFVNNSKGSWGVKANDISITSSKERGGIQPRRGGKGHRRNVADLPALWGKRGWFHAAACTREACGFVWVHGGLDDRTHRETRASMTPRLPLSFAPPKEIGERKGSSRGKKTLEKGTHVFPPWKSPSYRRRAREREEALQKNNRKFRANLHYP